MSPAPVRVPTPQVAPILDSVVERSGERFITKTTSDRVKTLDDLIRVCEIDIAVWEVVEWHANKWEMGFKDGDDRGQVLPLFQVKARLKPRVNVLVARDEIAALKVQAKEELNRLRPLAKVFSHTPSPYMLELDIFDLHLGKLAWAKETGYQNYDLKIAREDYFLALNALLERTSAFTFDEIIIPIGNDFFHTDSLVGETTHGTRQDMDGRFHKSAKTGREMLVETILHLRTRANKVTGIVVPGNHDQLTAWHLGDSLECYFHGDQGVEIVNTPNLRKFHEFGKVMLMFTHGNRGKQADYPLIMATAEKEMWARTSFREVHIGHLHKEKQISTPSVDENHGVKVRTLSSLCSTDAWHSEMMYVGNLRSASAFVWSATEGKVSEATFTLPED